MKITNKLNYIYLFVLLVAITSCSDNEEINSSDNLQENLVIGEQQSEYELFDDPNFNVATISKSNKARLGNIPTVRVGWVTTYLVKDKNATGKIYYRIRKSSDKNVIAQTGKIDVSNLATYSSSSTKYTILNYNLNRDLNIYEDYMIEVICEDCSRGENQNVYWWRSNNENYDLGNWAYFDGAAYNVGYDEDYWEPLPFDYAFRVQNKRDDGSMYKSQYSHEKSQLYAFGDENTEFVAQSFKVNYEFPCEPFDNVSIVNVSSIPVNDDEDNDMRIKFEIKNNSDKDFYFGTLLLVGFSNNTGESFDGRIPADYNEWERRLLNSIFNYASDEEVKTSRTIKANESAEFITTAFNSEREKYFLAQLFNGGMRYKCPIEFIHSMN